MTTPTLSPRDQVRLPGGRGLDLRRPQVMGIINVTPDSFSDGGRFLDPPAAVAQAEALAAAGAAVLDVGGESTRPGAAAVSATDELRRVLPVIEALAGRGLPPISIDTRKAAVAREAVAAGASLINDVSGLGDPAMPAVAAASGVAFVLGHIQGTPDDMQRAPRYADVVAEVEATLSAGCDALVAAGLPREALLVDPGIGFGKTLAHNLALLRALPRLAALAPVVVGVSRKSMLGSLLGGRPADQRLAAGLGAAAWAALHGAKLIRTHDVAETVDALRVLAALAAPEPEEQPDVD